VQVSHREVSQKDWPFILELRNEIGVRSSSFSDKLISESEHIRYMENLQGIIDFYQRIIVVDGVDAGYIKLKGEEVSYMIKPEFRGKGVMKQSFLILFAEMKKKGKTRIIAVIKPTNLASLKLVKTMGYELLEEIYNEGQLYAIKMIKRL
jgi:RimJ/RimL family protein N-acetyltransferase